MIAALFSPNRAYSNPPPLTGAQISVLEATDLKSCAAYFKQLQGLGYNTIILRVFHNQGDRFHGPVAETARQLQPEGVYFTNQQVPVVSDLLAPVCTLAHEAGLKIMAWMTTLKADYSHTLKRTVLSYNEQNGKVEAKAKLLDPAADENIDFLIHLFTDLAAQPIDGILLQDDLMLRHNQGFRIINAKISPRPEDLFIFKTGHATRIRSYRPKFRKWRAQQALLLQTLAQRIFSACRRVRPGIICCENIHYEMFYKESWGRDWFACTKAALTISKADYLMVMSYQERIQRELDLNLKTLEVAMNKIFTQARSWQKPQIIFKFTTPTSGNRNQQSLELLHRTINQARRHHWYDLVLTPCNDLTAARALGAGLTSNH